MGRYDEGVDVEEVVPWPCGVHMSFTVSTGTPPMSARGHKKGLGSGCVGYAVELRIVTPSWL